VQRPPVRLEQVRLRAVIYDLDGTLVDSREDLASSVNEMLADLGLPQQEDQRVWSFVGNGAERLVRLSLGPAHESRTAEALRLWQQIYGRRLLEKTRAYPGVAELLRVPPSARAVLTNKPGGPARRILAGLGLASAFQRVVGGDEASRKPDPQGLLRLCGELGAQPGEVLLVGDSAIDVATGAAAGVPVCAVTWGFGERASLTSASYLCDRPEELAKLLGQLTARFRPEEGT